MKTKLKILVFFLSVIPLSLYAQPNVSLFEHLEIEAGELDSEQESNYEKLINKNLYSNFEFVSLNDLGYIQENGLLKITTDLSDCHNNIFVGKNVAYIDNSNYNWYGYIGTINDNCLCDDGILMISKVDGYFIGYMQIAEKSFEIYELGGDLLAICEINENATSDLTCGASVDEGKINKNTSESNNKEKTRSSYCKVRVLFLFNQSALDAEPQILAKANLCMWQAKNAFLNSNILNSDLELEFAGIEFINGFIENNQIRISTEDLTTNSAANNLRNQYDADLVILLTDFAYGGGVAGNAMGLSWALDEEHGYAIVKVNYATIEGYTFCHELAHLFGCRHDTDPEPTMGHAKTGIASCCFLGHSKSTILFWDGPGKKYVIPNYSNPFVDYCDEATGNIPDKNNAGQLILLSCDVSSYRTSTALPFTAYINGPSSLCPNSFGTYSALHNGPSGSYTYVWEESDDGINWSFYSSSQSVMMQSSACFMQTLFLRVTINSPSGQAATSMMALVNSISPSAVNYPCNLSGVIFGSLCNNKPIPVQYKHDDDLVYPNPSSKLLYVKNIVNNTIDIEIKIYDLFGRMIYSNLFPSEPLLNLNISNLLDGIYVITIKTGLDIKQYKFSKN